jgi:phospholipase D1/2
MIGFEDGKNDESERRDNQNGKVFEGFAGSVVPTIEEKTIYERRPSQVHGNGQPLFDLIEGDESAKDGEDLTEARVHGDEEVGFGEQVPADKDQTGRGIPWIREPPGARKKADEAYSSDKAGREGDGKEELYGMPANAHLGDSDVPNANTDRDEGTEQERLAVKARKTLRKHLNAKTKVSPWSMPTPTPMIDPNRFHDPLDERFWKDMWTAVAVHNVS